MELSLLSALSEERSEYCMTACVLPPSPFFPLLYLSPPHLSLSLPQDVEDHCVLLCSLLLGYGLEAYVCVGTKAQGLAHSWVATIGSEGHTTFWESLTGQRSLVVLH